MKKPSANLTSVLFSLTTPSALLAFTLYEREEFKNIAIGFSILNLFTCFIVAIAAVGMLAVFKQIKSHQLDKIGKDTLKGMRENHGKLKFLNMKATLQIGLIASSATLWLYNGYFVWFSFFALCAFLRWFLSTTYGTCCELLFQSDVDKKTEAPTDATKERPASQKTSKIDDFWETLSLYIEDRPASSKQHVRITYCEFHRNPSSSPTLCTADTSTGYPTLLFNLSTLHYEVAEMLRSQGQPINLSGEELKMHLRQSPAIIKDKQKGRFTHRIMLYADLPPIQAAVLRIDLMSKDAQAVLIPLLSE